jgi:hypothetical protein
MTAAPKIDQFYIETASLRRMTSTPPSGRSQLAYVGNRSPLTDSNRPLLTMRSDRQLVATGGNGFGLFEAFSGPSHLRAVATGCDLLYQQVRFPMRR